MHRLRSRRTGWWVLLLLSCPATAWAKEPSLAGKLPKGAVAYAEVSRLGEAYDQLASSELWDKLRSSPGWDVAKQTQQYIRFQAGLRIAEAQLGTDALTAAKGLLGNRIAIALYPREPQPDAVALIRVADPALLKQVQSRVEAFVQLAAPQAFQNAEQIGGARIVRVRDRLFYLVKEDVVALASQSELLKTTARLLAGEEAESLQQDPNYTMATTGVRDEAIVRGYVNSGDIVAATRVAERPRKLDNALGSMLFGGIVELAVHCPSVAFHLDLQEDRLKINIRFGCEPNTLDGAYTGFFNPPESTDPVAVPRLPNVLGGLALYRDFKSLYQQREQLVQEKVLPGFDKFETGLATLLPGKDFAEDVLSTLDNRLTFIVAEQSYDYLDGKPGVRLPAFALIADLSKPEEGADLFRLLFQTVVGISNIQAGTQGRQPMILSAEMHSDVQIQYGRLLSKPSGDQLPIGFNFTPASALVGKRFVVSSSLELCRSLVDHLQKSESPQTGRRNFELELFPKAIAHALHSNRDLLQARLIQQGRTPQRAEGEFSLLLDILEYFEAVQLSHLVNPDSFDVCLEVSWR